MGLSPAQLAILKAEFTNDPYALGYAQYWTTTPFDGGLPPIINFNRDGATPFPGPGSSAIGRSGAITGATQATPIVITSTAHGLSTNDWVVIAGVLGNTAANNSLANPYWKITKVNNNSFSLNGSVGGGAYTSGGTWTWAAQIRNQSITTQGLLGAIDNRDLITDGVATAMTGDQFGKLTLFSLIAADGIISLTNADGSDNQNLHTIKQCLNDTNGSKSRVIVLSNRVCSRAEQLFGDGVFVSTDDVSACRLV